MSKAGGNFVERLNKFSTSGLDPVSCIFLVGTALKTIGNSAKSKIATDGME